MGIPFIDISGPPRERGRAHGEALRESIEASLDFYMPAFQQPEDRLRLVGGEVRALVARTFPALWRIQKINERRMLSNLGHAFAQLLPREEARSAAAGLAAMIEGLWLRCALSSGPLTMSQARLIAHDYVDRLLREEP